MAFPEMLDIRPGSLGPTHTDTLVSKAMLARAEVPALEAYDGLVQTLGPDHPCPRAMTGIPVAIHRDRQKPGAQRRWRSRLDAIDAATRGAGA